MESQSFVFLKLKRDVLEPSTILELFEPQWRIYEISASAVDRIRLTEPEQVGFSVVSRKINFPVEPEKLHHLFELLQVFLKNLPQPVCLVAHNGNNLDFPTLKSEWEKILGCEDSGPAIAATFNNVYCVDSAEAFLKFFSLPVPTLAEVDKASKHLFFECNSENVEPNASNLVRSELNVSDYDEELWSITQMASELYDEKNFSRKEMESDLHDQYYLNKLTEHGRTKKTEREEEPNWKNIRQDSINCNEKTPLRGKNDNRNSQEAIHRPFVDVSLRSVYSQVFNESLTTCNIEGEVEALAEIVAHLGIPMLEMFEMIKVPFLSN